MSEIIGSPANFWSQSNALLRKNLTFQKRRMCANIALILIPGFFCILFASLQGAAEFMSAREISKACKTESAPPLTPEKAAAAAECAITSPTEWPPLLQLPEAGTRAVRASFFPFTDLPDESCRKKECPVTILMTGKNQTIAQRLATRMLPAGSFPAKSNGNLTDWSTTVMGSVLDLLATYNTDPAFILPDAPIYNVQKQCPDEEDSMQKAKLQVSKNTSYERHVQCLPCLHLWRNSSSDINNELYKGYRKGNSENKINKILTAYDFSNTDAKTFNVSIWYNTSGDNSLLRIPRLLNMASNAYLWYLKGPRTKIMFDFVKEMPKGQTVNKLDISSLLGTVFFTWVILQLFPVVLTSLVYEKQEKLRMHGLGDGPYWLISYSYFYAISQLYIMCFVGFGTLLGLNFFRANDYSLQFTFYLLYVNLQIALAFLFSSAFSTTRAATVVAYIFVFGSGLLGGYFFQYLISSDMGVPKAWVILLELYPGFSLYRGLYEFGQYSMEAKIMGSHGMGWGNLNDSLNGMKDVLIIMVTEWAVLLILALYIDQVFTCGKSSLFFLRKKSSAANLHSPTLPRQGSKDFGEMEKPDVAKEREKVEKLMAESKYTSHVVICNNIKKMYPGRDGNPEKFAVRGVSLALPQGKCFGMLGPSGAGKTSFIEMMIGLTKPTTGTAYVQGLDIVTQMHEIYNCIGVCPQHDLLWGTLTGREHLLFYGRLKNLKGSTLTRAVEESLKNLNLFNGGVADKQARQYSGGMKRRLSVAISLIGNPIAIYMDEPSTGLDPASRNTLWNVIKISKQGRVIFLTTHSMEEAEFLCDRLGIFIDGRLQCIGNPKELKGRYGGSYVFTMTTNACHEQEVESMVRKLSPNANRVYHLAGTQKFELPKSEVRIADMFQTVEQAKRWFTVYAWGLADTTLEDVFIKVAGTKKLESKVLSRDNLIE